MIEFIAALYNEENQIINLLAHVAPYVDKINLVDDGSTDNTVDLAMWFSQNHGLDKYVQIEGLQIEHTGLPETVKAEALNLVDEDSWVIMLDADERFAPGVLDEIKKFIESPESENYTHIWFDLEEFIDQRYTRHFLKCRVFRKSAATFSDSVHVADSFSGAGFSGGWAVLHSKTSAKQIQREKEYLATYDKLVSEGKMTPEKREELKGYHYFVR